MAARPRSKEDSCDAHYEIELLRWAPAWRREGTRMRWLEAMGMKRYMCICDGCVCVCARARETIPTGVASDRLL